jgi:hypothetical protein
VVLYELIEARSPTADDFNDADCRMLFQECSIAQLVVQYGYKYLKMPVRAPVCFQNIMLW